MILNSVKILKYSRREASVGSVKKCGNRYPNSESISSKLVFVPIQVGVYSFGCMDPTQDLHIPKLVSLVTNRDDLRILHQHCDKIFYT